MTGKFITFEGGEGAGKSTQIRRLSALLSDKNISHVLTREPGGSLGAEAIRSILVQGSADRWEPVTELLLMFAARADHWHKLIKPALAEGTWVICDRFADSSVAYQGYGRGLSLEFIQSLYENTVGKNQPDLTFILDVDPAVGLGRSKARLQKDQSNEGRFEALELDFHRRIHQGFLEIAKAASKRCRVIDANRAPEDVFTQIQTIITPLIK